ncbi:hypothetical protein AMS68_005502 [Peltaster fructicola]|uniref:Phospholipid/glycerol acyltransferase domain-containing protein n=1 Tax=Peltaster fructicola TaxID=286661 RepID=A0A6H0XZ88_9PEZI|nr:hypothetical protein AMS68_005502 [Peltaster fructicola]
MEKYGQYRDKGIAPFFPIPPHTNGLVAIPWGLFLLFLRTPLTIFAWIIWLIIIQWAPPGTILRKANLWCIIGIPGIWWVDLQVDGVRRGSLGKYGASHMPTAGSIIASSHTSPIDVIYLATIFDPIFTQSYPGTRLVRQLSLSAALASCLTIPTQPSEGLTTLAELTARHPKRIIAVFPEGTTSNGRGILQFTHSLLSASPSTKIFPVSIRYAPQDIVTPIPGFFEALRFLWRLNGQSSHTVRTRIGTAVTRKSVSASSTPTGKITKRSKYEGNFFDTLDDAATLSTDDDASDAEKQVLDAVADTLARLGRVKRVSLGLAEKTTFVAAWRKNSKYRK